MFFVRKGEDKTVQIRSFQLKSVRSHQKSRVTCLKQVLEVGSHLIDYMTQLPTGQTRIQIAVLESPKMYSPQFPTSIT